MLKVVSDSWNKIYFFSITAVCNPNCENGGVCVEPNNCRCKVGYTGNLCENGKK